MDTRFEVKKNDLLVYSWYIVSTEVCDDVPDMERLLMEIVEHRLVEV